MCDISVKHATQADLPAVRIIWRRNSRTLGFLPEGAFIEAVSESRLIVAVDSSDLVAGYLLYRFGRGRCSIVHLCSSDTHRGRGIAQLLNTELRRVTRDMGCTGVGLFCRRDYGLDDFWAHLGYVPLSDKQGRSSTGHLLTFWWLDHHQPDLFTYAGESGADDRFCVAIDTNVLIRMHSPSTSPSNEVAKALEADWLSDLVEFCVTPEALVEANRSPDKARRDETRRWIHQHRMLKFDKDTHEAAREQLARYIPPDLLLTENDISDFNHAVYALASGAGAVVTLDEALLARASGLPDELGLRVMDPATFVLELDQILREGAYAPARLAGSQVQKRLVRDDDRAALGDHFQAAGLGESRAQFDAKLRTFLAAPSEYKVDCVEHPTDGLLALSVRQVLDDHCVAIPMMRLRPGRLASTLARHMISELIGEKMADEKRRLEFRDAFAGDTVEGALLEHHFRKRDGSFLRASWSGFRPARDISTFLQDQGIADVRAPAPAQESPQAERNLELAIWPGKIRDSSLPCYAVSIHPTYAMHLFDSRLAAADLIGSDIELALACENIYYRSNQQCGLTAPARILWYVKKDARHTGCMSIRACSMLDAVMVDTPKALYRRYKRLGVYEWQDLASMVKDPASEQIMAFLFSHTELFPSPIPWSRLNELGIKASLQSPVRVPTETFEAIYTMGMTNG